MIFNIPAASEERIFPALKPWSLALGITSLPVPIATVRRGHLQLNWCRPELGCKWTKQSSVYKVLGKTCPEHNCAHSSLHNTFLFLLVSLYFAKVNISGVVCF